MKLIMKNYQGILNLNEKKIYFKFENEDIVMDLTEGDLHDNWNSFRSKNGNMYDLNFHWLGYSEKDKPNLTLYSLVDNGDETWSTNFNDGRNIKIIEVIGTEGAYFNIPFDGVKTDYFELFDDSGVLQLKTKKFNKASDLSVINNWKQVCVDVYGNRKNLN